MHFLIVGDSGTGKRVANTAQATRLDCAQSDVTMYTNDARTWARRSTP
jgi:hypothetical protein